MAYATDYDANGVNHVSIADFQFSDGAKLDIKVAYRSINQSAKKAVLIPTCFGGLISSTLSFTELKGKALDEYHVIVVAMLSNGESSSPSNTPGFPKALRYQDQVNAQQALLKSLGVEELEAVIGFSMGGQQAWYWGVMFGGSGSGIRTKRIVTIASSAATSPHNYTFLEGPIGALEASSDYDDGAYKFKSGSEVELLGAERPKPLKGLRAFGRAYAAWLTSPAWFREEKWRDLGAKSLRNWIDPEKSKYAGWDAEDLLVLAKQWQDGDVTSVAPGNPKDWKQALRQMQCPVLIMTSSSDQYFRLEVGEMEREALGDKAVWRPIDTIWGHVAGGGANPDDVEFMDACIAEFLNKERSSTGGATKENNPLQDIAVIEAVPAS